MELVDVRPSEAAHMARQALAQGDSTRALTITERLLGEFARYPPARLVRALLAEQANNTDAALDDLRAVTSAEPANAEARAAQARLFQRRGDTDRARMAARQALELIPTDPDVLESALEVLDVNADALDTSTAVLARVHLNCGWPDLAERHARVAVSESPERVDVRLTLAEALWRLGRLPACEAECRVGGRSSRGMRARGRHARAHPLRTGPHGRGPGVAGPDWPHRSRIPRSS